MLSPALHAGGAGWAHHAPSTARLGRAAVASLYEELALAPKPGLVSFIDSGSHDDMDARTFMRSLFALRHYFPRIAAAGAGSEAFAELEALGITAEAEMLAATRGINTHRGAIFLLGLLCAAGGAVLARRQPLTADSVRQALLSHWGAALRARATGGRLSHGGQVAQALGLRGARQEAALGFPVLFDHALPALHGALQRGLDPRRARLQCLFATIAVLDDTTLAHRGGLAGLRFAQAAAQEFLDGGGAGHRDALDRANHIHRQFVARRLSAGGAADVLAATCWLHRVTGGIHGVAAVP